jgi:hypothetical protein
VMTTSLEADGDATRVVSRVRPEGVGRLSWLKAAPRPRRRLEGRYQRLATLMPVHIPEGKRLPLAAPAT